MRKLLSRVLFAAVIASLLLLFTGGSHTAYALPRYGSDIVYYDGNWNYLGERYQSCDGGITWDGTRTGAVYEYVDQWDCDAYQTPGVNGCCYTDQNGNCIGTVGSVSCGF